MSEDIEKIKAWQKSGDPVEFAQLMVRYQPVVNRVVNQFKTVGVSPSTLKTSANTQLIKALKSYDDKHGTQPTTHIYNNLKKVQRIASESLLSGHIPENRNLQRSTFTITRDNMTDRLGYEPSVQQMAEELKWDKKEVGRMNEELSGETTASRAEFDFYGNSTQGESRDAALVDYLYHELDGPDQVIFEHTFGYGGKPVLKSKQIASKLGKNEMWVVRRRKAMGKKIKEYR
jgi:DNA-directed RNA polymerase specialized sigma subunit